MNINGTMADKLSGDLPTNKTTSSSSGVLLTLTVVTVTIWIAQYHWKRRHLYRHSAKLPGPPGYPLVGSGLKFINNSSEELFNNLTELFEEYPELFKVWFGNSLFYMVSKPEHLEIILNSPSCLEKSSLYHHIRKDIGSGLLTARVPTWKRHRRLISPVFNQKLLNGFLSAFNKNSSIFLEILDQKLAAPDTDIFKMLSLLNLDILGDTIIGVQLNGQTDQETKLGELLDTVMMIVFLRAGTIWYHVDFIFNLSKLSKTLYQAKTVCQNFSKKIVSEKRKISDEKIQKLTNGEVFEEEGNVRKTLLDVLFLVSDKGVKLTDTEIQEEVDIFVAAGVDTTASTIGFILSMLGMHPDIQQKVFEEILDVVGPDGDVAVEHFSELKLMDRVIRETLRLFPIAPYIFRRSEAEVNLGDAIVPAHCEIGLGIFRLHRNEKYWKDPLKFDPDRFLPEEVAKRHPYTYLAFSGGPRNCIGYRYAMMSMKVIVSKIIRRYVVSTSYKTVDEIKLFSNLVLRIKDGYKLQFKIRE